MTDYTKTVNALLNAASELVEESMLSVSKREIDSYVVGQEVFGFGLEMTDADKAYQIARAKPEVVEAMALVTGAVSKLRAAMQSIG